MKMLILSFLVVVILMAVILIGLGAEVLKREEKIRQIKRISSKYFNDPKFIQITKIINNNIL